MIATIETIIQLFTEKGSQLYGAEAVSQLEHALQCATLAQNAGESNELITACLLHDVGHLIHNLGDNAATRGIDDRHEYRAIPLLNKMFAPAVTEPIRLHVAAKRYLCQVNSEYWSTLSSGSVRSLELQGGKFSPEAAETFISQPYAEDAVKLRIYDDQAKVANLQTPDLNHFIPSLNACLHSRTLPQTSPINSKN
ncbi:MULTISPECIES: phosphonate degradation HD-domain oxygenase [Nostoc]|uniref:HD domain-containing protein n=1 Tax=Nostoc paludosum FACHB-159 TaxID=2692908 RepID=A0ABR8K0N4_9NOSO|nr:MULTISPECIES: phosphonate degradation HD-domain oxygenase [Nostoc]MBD2677181.1 HD domain-containing protein [Nostoc sp. FACHB-857]MBD2733010.1 HD domain-containing protein [Nostoc paludosum FACHB-159]